MCSNDYEDHYTDLFLHGHIITSRSFSPLQRHPNSEGWLLLDEDFSRYQPFIYCGCCFHKELQVDKCLNNILKEDA